MKVPGLLLACGLAALGQNPKVQGIAVDGETGLAMPGVHIRLISGGMEGIDAAYGAMSMRDGRFSIDGVKPGAYNVAGERRGYLYVPPEGAPPLLTIKSGADVTGLKVRMLRRSIITGRVVDPAGDPIERAAVQARPVNPVRPRGGAMLWMSGPPLFAQTDDRGEYRLTLPPGKWRIRADANSRPRRFGLREVRTDGSASPVYVETFYPSASSESDAGVVETTPGAEIAGIDIVMNTAGPGLLSVSGAVTGLDAKHTAAFVILLRGDGMAASSHSSRTEGGKFNIGGLQPGKVRVYAMAPDPENPLYSPMVELALESDISNLELPLSPGGEIAGKFEMLGETPAAAARARRKIGLRPAGPPFSMMPGQGSVEIDQNGRFRLDGVAPGKYRVGVDPLPENAYIKSVVLDGSPSQGGIIDCTQGCRDSTLSVTASPNGATVSGTVLEKSGEPALNVIGGVYLMQDPEEPRPDTMARVDAKGRYQFKAVAPGKYRIFVVDSNRMAFQWDRDLFKKLFAAAEPLEVHEGDRIKKDLPAVPKEAPDAR